MFLLIVGDPEDLTAVYVAFRAERRGVPVVRLEESRFGVAWRFAFDDEKPEEDEILAGGSTMRLREVAGAYVRFHHSPDHSALNDLEPDLAELYLSQRRSAMHLLLSRLQCPVANPPSAGHSNGSKPYQMQLLESAGFRVPRWVATNDPAEVRRFSESCPEGSIAKSCSGVRSQVRALDDDFLRRVERGSTPVVVQKRIVGHDVRVHTVGDSVFGTKIASTEGVDYRFTESPGAYEDVEVPPDIATRCVQFARGERLLIGGLDFRVDPGGAWWCLECNPAPTFLPYEMSTGQPIADALLDMLCGRETRVETS